MAPSPPPALLPGLVRAGALHGQESGEGREEGDLASLFHRCDRYRTGQVGQGPYL